MKESVLILEDCQNDPGIVLNILKEEYECDTVQTYSAAIKHIKQKSYSAIIVDFYLESNVDSEALKSLEHLRTHTNGSVFIVCSTNDDIVGSTEIGNIDAFICKKRVTIIPDRLKQISKSKKEVYEKFNIFSTLVTK
jgi:DNA-binding NtrC family response regulator